MLTNSVDIEFSHLCVRHIKSQSPKRGDKDYEAGKRYNCVIIEKYEKQLNSAVYLTRIFPEVYSFQESVGANLENISIFCSSAVRARKTAELILEQLRIKNEIIVMEGLREFVEAETENRETVKECKDRLEKTYLDIKQYCIDNKKFPLIVTHGYSWKLKWNIETGLGYGSVCYLSEANQKRYYRSSIKSLGNLCYDELVNILFFLNPKSILSILLTNKTYYEIIESRERDVWKQICISHYSELSDFLEFFPQSKDAYRRCVTMSNHNLDIRTLLKLMKLRFKKGRVSYRLILFDLYFLLPQMISKNLESVSTDGVNTHPSIFLDFLISVIKKGSKDDMFIKIFLKRWINVVIGFDPIPESKEFKEICERGKKDSEFAYYCKTRKNLSDQILHVNMLYLMKGVFEAYCNGDCEKGLKQIDVVKIPFFDNNFFVFDDTGCFRALYGLVYGLILLKNKNLEECLKFMEDHFWSCLESHIDDCVDFGLYNIIRNNVLQKVKDCVTELKKNKIQD